MKGTGQAAPQASGSSRRLDITVALRHANNQPRPLLSELMRLGGATASLDPLDVDGLGVIADFRRDWATDELCLHVEATPAGLIIFRREGGDAFTGGAVEFVASALDFSRETAIAFLTHRADVQESPAAVFREVRLGNGRSYVNDNGGLALRTEQRDRKTGEFVTVTQPLAEFQALIVEIITYETGGQAEADTEMIVAGFNRHGQPLTPPRIRLLSKEFAAMRWPLERWPTQATVLAGSQTRDHVRTAIELQSHLQTVHQRTVYRHVGWVLHPRYGRIYVTAGAVIGSQGAIAGIDVDLPVKRLEFYQLPEPPVGDELQLAIRASLALIDVVADRYSVGCLAVVYRSPLGHLDAVLWPTGKSGRQKTSLLVLMQLHFGTQWTERELLLGWQSTISSIEVIASRARDALVLIDDFKPAGDWRVVAQKRGDLSRFLQGVGDGGARNALNHNRTLQKTPELCGAFACSSETYPLGQSDAARAIIMPVTEQLAHDDHSKQAMRAAQANGEQGLYTQATAGYIHFLAKIFDTVYGRGSLHITHVRQYEKLFSGGHARTPVAMAELSFGWRMWLHYAVTTGAITTTEADTYWHRVGRALTELAAAQASDQMDEDPVHRVLTLLAGLFDQQRVHVSPLKSEQAAEASEADPEPTEADQHPTSVFIGWLSASRTGDTWVHLLPDAVYEALNDSARRQNAALPDKKTLMGLLRDDLRPIGLMRCDQENGRFRSEHSVLINGERRRLLTLRWPLTVALNQLGIQSVAPVQHAFPTIDWTAEI